MKTLLRVLHGRLPVTCVAVALALAFAVAGTPASGGAEYEVGPGDVIELRVTGVPDLSQRTPVELDGTVSLPVAGKIRVSGLSAPSMRARIEAALASKVLRQKDPNGRLRVVAIQPGDIVVSIVEYRPVYVDGDVLNPGQYPYRPSMTVRQVVALAGGYSMLRSRQFGLDHDVFDLSSQHRSTGALLAKEQVYAARLQAELDDREDFQTSGFETLPVAESTLAEIIREEAEALRISRLEYRQVAALLTNAAARITDHIRVLIDAKQKEEQELRANLADLDRVTKAYGLGNLPSPRVTEARRAIMENSNRRLQVMADLIRAQQERDEQQRRLDKIANDRRTILLEKMGQSRVRLVELGARMEAVDAQLALTGKGHHLLPMGNQMIRPALNIVRKSGSEEERRIDVNADSELEPGDVVDVRFPASQALSLAPTTGRD